MSITKRIEEQKHYREELEKVSHLFDAYILEVKEKVNKSLEAKTEGSSYDFTEESNTCNMKELIFVLHLRSFNLILTSIEHPECISLLLYGTETNVSFGNKTIFTPGDLYDRLLQMPKDSVIQFLSNLCDEIDDYSLIESFRQDDKEAFVQSFGKVENKRYFFDKFNSLFQAIEIWRDSNEMLNGEPCDYDTLIHMGREASLLMDYVGPLHYHYEEFLHQLCNGIIPTDISYDDLLDDYKKLIIKSIELNLTPIELEIINKMVTNHGYDDTYKKLYPQCLKKVQHEALMKGREQLLPINFPEHLGVEVDKREPFLRALYDILVNDGYIAPDRADDFVYLLGGQIARPDDLKPINWLKGHNRKKRQVQCFFIAFLDIPKIVENKNEHNWKGLAALNTWENKIMTTFNNPEDAYVDGLDEINRFKNTLSGLIAAIHSK